MTAPRHILMTTDTVGGVWVYATTLARAMAARGARITLVTMGPPPLGARYAEAHSLPPEIELVVTDLDLEWRDPEGRDVRRARDELLRIADRVAPDLVHLNGFREGAIPWPCPSLIVAHSCVLSWWHATRNEWPNEPRWSSYAEAVAAGLEAAAAWVAPSRAMRSAIRTIYSPPTPGHVIANGTDAFPPFASPREPLILASGRVWDDAKNLDALAAVAGDLPWPVQIAGAGGEQVAGAAQACTESVQWLGELARDKLRQRMRRASIYAAPALYEPFGLGILEAAAAGCALVLSDIPSLRELWQRAALFVAPGDRCGLRDALLELCRNQPLRRQLQHAAVARSRLYCLDRAVNAYRTLYAELLAPVRPGRTHTSALEVRA